MNSKRYIQLDGLRGLFLIIMVLDHFEGPFRKLLYEKFGYFTGAEGFVFISGIVAGIVYSKIDNTKLLWIKSINRVFKIYRYHILTVIVLFLVMIILPFYSEYWKTNLMAYQNDPWWGLLSSIFLLYQPNPIDILPLYIFFVLLMPVMMSILHKGKYVMYFIIILLLWGISQFQFSIQKAGIFYVNMGFFNYSAWQILFFIGLYFGLRKRKEQNYALPVNTFSVFGAILICTFFFILKISSLLELGIFHLEKNFEVYKFIFRKNTLGIGRIINFLALSYLVYCVLQIKKSFFTSKYLLILGQKSIQVFTLHTLTLILFYPFIEKIVFHGMVASILFSLCMILILYIYAFWSKSNIIR